ncbi:hypothetical protein CDD82_6625 [Ophiocordyceps australis]|uniref:GPI2-domain-containing protein n=1 Tax=Ophiocordyceps australis TaxID=1399860 RepID=A0A2C5ZR71_9HYPO|nr:hypothetical protein CDD82_6625 [Ophiocordyceps australis]
MPSPTDDEAASTQPLSRTSTLNSSGRSHLSPQDAAISPPLRARAPGLGALGIRDSDGPASLARMSHLGAQGSTSRHRHKRTWKKLMWVKQSYPDNYTDQATFLEHLQRNPRLKPYDFWPLVADSTVILQHVCSIILFIVCFVGIFQERVSPVSVVSWSSFATLIGWILWERWVSEEEDQDDDPIAGATVVRAGSVRRRARAGSIRRPPLSARPESKAPVPCPNSTSRPTLDEANASLATNMDGTSKPQLAAMLCSSPPSNNRLGDISRMSQATIPEDGPLVPPEANRTHQRLETIKSALLIYCTLLGLSPILKSLTRSTSSDSIWAMSFWLLAINVFFFDYSGGVGVKFPASLSTNAALMASTVLASRLPSTKQVFSLTLFSIEVFGLFPVFRRHVKHRSWRYHSVLTAVLVLGAGWGMGIVLGDAKAGTWPWKSGIVGMVVGVLASALASGGCSWWLIGLQKYKNEIRGPWDPARPIIMSRTRWSDR